MFVGKASIIPLFLSRLTPHVIEHLNDACVVFEFEVGTANGPIGRQFAPGIDRDVFDHSFELHYLSVDRVQKKAIDVSLQSQLG